MQIKRKNIVICSMILLLFIIGYAYNSFTNTKYTSAKYDLQFSNVPDKTEVAPDQNQSEDQSQAPVQEDKNTTAAKDNKAKASKADSKAKATTSTNETNANPEITVVSEAKDPQKEIASASFFSEYRMERDKNRSKEVDMWQDIISSQSTEKTFKNLAQQEIVKIVALTEKEMIIENLIISRGFNDALVFLTDDSATVIVDAKELTQANVAQIQDIVVRKTKLDPTNIKIMKKN